MKRLVLAALLWAAADHAQAADALDSLREALRGLPGKSAVSAAAERKIDFELTDKPHEQSSVRFNISAGPSGLQLSFPQDVVARVESDRQNLNPDQPHSTVRALDYLYAADLASALNGALDLLRDLDGATLRSDTATTLNGAPARLLEADIVLRMTTADVKRVKKSTSVLKVWLGADGVPLAMERSVQAKGSVMLISFEFGDTLARSFTRKGDRLVAVREERRISSAGFGATSRDERITTIQLQ